MPGDQKENRTGTEAIPDDGVYDVPGASQVKQQCAGVENISQETIQHRYAHDGVVLLHLEDVNHKGDHIGAAGKSNAGHHVEPDP